MYYRPSWLSSSSACMLYCGVYCSCFFSWDRANNMMIIIWFYLNDGSDPPVPLWHWRDHWPKPEVVQPFLQDSPCVQQTDHATCDMCSNRLHVCCGCGCVAARRLDCHFFSSTPAPLGKSCVSTGGPTSKPSVGYNALTDPHLYDFFVRKLKSMDPLMPTEPSQVNIGRLTHTHTWEGSVGMSGSMDLSLRTKKS